MYYDEFSDGCGKCGGNFSEFYGSSSSLLGESSMFNQWLSPSIGLDYIF